MLIMSLLVVGGLVAGCSSDSDDGPGGVSLPKGFPRSEVPLLTDGTVLTPALGIGAFAEKTLVAAGQCTKVPRADAAAVGLLGCGVMAGFGAAVNTGGVGRGDSVAVIGCGGVGNAAIAGAALAGATTIVAVDVDDRKLEGARRFGATHTVNSREQDPVEAIRALTGGHGADVVIEAVGRPETYGISRGPWSSSECPRRTSSSRCRSSTSSVAADR